MPELFFDIRFNANESDLKTVKDEANRIQKEVNQSLEGDTSKKAQATKATRAQAKAEKDLIKAQKEKLQSLIREKNVAEANFKQGKINEAQLKETTSSVLERAKSEGLLSEKLDATGTKYKSLAQAQLSASNKVEKSNESRTKSEKQLFNEFKRQITVNEVKFRQGELSQKQALDNAESIERQAIETGVLTDQTLRGARAQKTMFLSQQRIQTGFTGMAQTSARANQSLMNLGRIVQDLPFGFLGISNNIDPALNSFRELRKESGSTGGALKALLGSLAGSGGLIFALGSLLPTAVLIAQKGFNMYRKRADESKDATDNLSDSVKSFVSESTGLRETDAFSFLDRESLRRSIESIELLNPAMTDFEETQKRLNQIDLDWWQKLTVSVGELAEYFMNLEDIKRFNQQLEDLEAQTGLTADDVGYLNDKLEETNRQIRITTALTQQNPLARFKEWFSVATTDALDNFDTGLVKSKDRLRELAGFINQTIIDLQRGDADVMASLGLSEEDIRPAIQILQKQLGDLEDFIPERPTIPIKIPKDEIIDNIDELNMLMGDVGIEPIEMPPVDWSVYEESEKELKAAQKQLDDDLLAEKLLNLELYMNEYNRIAKMQEQVDRSLAQSRIQLERNVLSALTSLSQAFAKDNKALAITILAIEKGVQMAGVIMDGIKRAGQATALGHLYTAMSFLNPAFAGAAGLAYAQASKITGMTIANAAAIAAQGLGESISISNRGSRSVGAGGTGFSGNDDRVGFFTDEPESRDPIRPAMTQITQLQVSFEDGVDEVIAIKAQNGAKKIKKGTIFVTE